MSLKIRQELNPRPHFYAAQCHLDLGFLYSKLNQLSEAEAQHQQALGVFVTICEYSISTCICLNSLDVLGSMRYYPATKLLSRSHCVCFVYFPDTAVYGQCLFYQGLLAMSANCEEESVEKLQAAIPLLRKHESDLAEECERTLQKLRRCR